MMLTKQEIQNQYREYSRHSPGLYLDIPTAVTFVNECDANDLLIIGIEAFTLFDDGTIEPRSDLIADYSYVYVSKDDWALRKSTCNSMAKAFLAELPNEAEIVVNFVVVLS